MNYFKAVFAIVQGLKYCLSHSEIRRLAVWPWLIGAVCYFSSVVAAWKLHPVLLARLVDEPSGFFATIWFGVVWALLALSLVVLSMIVSIVLVMALSGVFQTAIAARVLKASGYTLPEEPAGVSGNFQEILRTILVESAKLFWLVPLIILVAILGFIPLLLPFTLVAGSWLLAYQFVDIVLDLYRLRTRERIAFAFHHLVLLCCFGLALTALWAIPFVGLLLPPAAVAGAAWLLADTRLLLPIEERAGLRKPDTSSGS